MLLPAGQHADGDPRLPKLARRALVIACSVHVLHDGYSDLLYVLMPIWQHEFGLTFAAVGLLRTLYSGAMAGLQLPSVMLAERLGAGAVLAAGTAFAGICFWIAGSGSSYGAIAAALLAGGLGASVQHPIASGIVARAFEHSGSRKALGTYNFAGDIGKMALPGLTGVLLGFMVWRSVLWIIGGVGLLVAAGVAIAALRGAIPVAAEHSTRDAPHLSDRGRWFGRGFSLLLSMGAIDTATRTGFLVFLPFVLTAKGASITLVGLCLMLIFAGGAAGKFACGFLGDRIGVLPTVIVTEGATALGILVLLVLPLAGCVAILPVIGIALNGTSSVLYGSIPELVPRARRERAFSVFYTGAIGSGALAPILAGMLSDWRGVTFAMISVACLVTTTIPLAAALEPMLRQSSIDALG